ncbi:DUF368 domain-containing protein [Gracilibacillus phocaeensis]|uniref:DUF368 domain-containing protein n=1 Tax=Gracilibacillus phocaeensis TaxID=2042304 RepID=UPI00102FB6BA|nr:DUF368 domain-containing protein [Gracilibacillus phocaeensis]
MEWRNIFRGLLMGASDVIPGVSGGTIAVVLGIYERLIAAINGIFSRDYKKHLSFLIPLGIGMVLAAFALANLIEWLFEHYPQQTQFAFLGLIIGVLPFLFHKSQANKTFKLQHVVLLLIGAGLVSLMLFFRTSEGDAVTDLTMSTYLWLFGSGFLASTAMILPGISGSFLLLIMGSYSTIMGAVSDLDLPIILVTGTGILLGLIFMSKIINYFLNNFPIMTYAFVIGMVIGSIFVIFPGWTSNMLGNVMCGVMFFVGLLAAFLLGKIEYR